MILKDDNAADLLSPRGAWITQRRICVQMIAVVFLVFFCVYRISPNRQVFDSNYTMLLSESIYKHGTFDLKNYVTETDAETKPVGDLPYQLHRIGERIYYTYPPGGPLLSVPLAMVLNAAGLSAIDANGRFDPKGEAQMQKWTAAFLGAAAVALLFWLAALWLPMLPAVCVTIAAGLGTSIWSTASRAVWSQSWQIVLLTIVLLMMAYPDRWLYKHWLRAALLGTLLAWMFFVRPTSCIPITGILVFVMMRQRRAGMIAEGVAAIWLAVFFGWSEWFYGALQPPYYQGAGEFSTANGGVALLGQLVSPSRGLVVFSPWLVAVMALVIWNFRRMPAKGLTVLAMAVIAVHWLLVSLWGMWWFGHSYGPRAFLDVIPWFVLLAVLGMARMRETERRRFNPVGIAAAGVLVAASIWCHGVGAISPDAIRWNVDPVNVDQHPEHVWDWHDPQFMRWRKARVGN